MSLDNIQEGIVSLLEKNPQGLGQNQMWRELSCAKGTFLDRLNKLEKAGMVTYTEGSRKSKIYQLNDEILKGNRATWAFNILMLHDAINLLSEEAASRHSNRLKLARATFLVQNEVSKYIFRLMYLKNIEGLLMNWDREQMLSGVVVDSLFDAYAAFQRKIGATHGEVDSAIIEVDLSRSAAAILWTKLRMDRSRKDVDEWLKELPRQLPRLWKRTETTVNLAARSTASLWEKARKRSDEYQELLQKPEAELRDTFKREIEVSFK